ncbi:competence type IV pilus minor pilin ComGG [Alteribacter lacisalsi]|nr:competence type IV pilus minor pilin ComGG [Alteribacter lacisalsi]
MNNKGYILLFTVAFLFLLSAAILQAAIVIEQERQFNFFHREMVTVDHLILTGTAHVTELILFSEGDTLASGKLQTGSGSIWYRVDTESDMLRSIRLDAVTTGGTNRSASFRLNMETGAVTDWREGSAAQ